MNHSELVEAIAADNDVSKAEAKKVLDSLVRAVSEAAEKGDEVAISGLGKFKVKESPARQGRNPATGQAIKIAASKKLTFAPAKAVKDRLNR